MRLPLRTSVVVLLCVSLAACHAMRARPEAVGAVSPEAFPSTVRLTRVDGSQVKLFQASLSADTIRGQVANGLHVRVAAKDVTRWEAQEFSGTRSTLATIVVAFAGFIIYETFPRPVPVFGPGAVVRAP